MPQDPHDEGQAPSTTRRALLTHLGAAGLAASLGPFARAEVPMAHPSTVQDGDALTQTPVPSEPLEADAEASEAPGAAPGVLVPLALSVNGKSARTAIDPRASLLDTLRESLHLTGTKKGCDHGQCGACTVHVDGRRVLSCLTLALSAQGHEITTIEGLGTPERMHPMQAAFVAHDGYQCGYCTSGQIMSAVALVEEPVGPEDADVKEAMSGNICRCGAYANIVDAIQEVRKA
jgi:xanthine dehydrogenase YagT iron-sulfur-binding subunit